MIRQETGDEQQQALIELTKEGAELDLKLISRHDEHCFVPVHLIDDKLQEMSQEDLNALSNKDRAELALKHALYGQETGNVWAYTWVIWKMMHAIAYRS